MAPRGTSGATSGRHATDDLLVRALAAGATIDTAAAFAKVSRRTAFRRMRDPDFRRRVADERDQLLQAASAQLVANMNRAVRRLVGLLDAPDDRVKLRASVAIVDGALKARDAVDVAERLRALEDQRGHP